MNQLQVHFFASPPRKSVCQDATRIIEPKLDDTQCGFHRGRSSLSITEQISTLQQIWDILGAWQRHMHMFCRPRENIWPGSSWKSFGECCGSTMLMGLLLAVK